MRVTNKEPGTRKQFELNRMLYCLVGENHKGHLLYARFKDANSRNTGMLTGFFIDNGRQLNEIDIEKLNYADFKKQSGQSESVSVRKSRNTTATVGRRDVPKTNRNRKV